MLELEVQQHLKDCLFHGVWMHIRDSIRFLYSTPRTSQSQLMVATCKAESENEEIWDNVRARTAMTSHSREGTTELGQQIAKLMAILTMSGQGSSPARGCGRGQTGRNAPGHLSSHNSQTSLGQTAPDDSTPTGHGIGTTISGNKGQNSQGTNTRCEGTANRRDPNSLQCFRCQGWGNMAQECPTPATALNQSVGNWGNVAQPPTGASCNSQQWAPAFPPWPLTKTNKYKSSPKDGMAGSYPSPFPQPWPHCLLGGVL